jgi:hypothetical protein
VTAPRTWGARYRCRCCQHEWVGFAGPVVCPACAHLWVDWLNYAAMFGRQPADAGGAP